MRIIDDSTNKVLTRVTVLFDKQELNQLIGYAEALMKDPNDHSHINDESYKRELTIARSDGDRSKLDPFTRSIVEAD